LAPPVNDGALREHEDVEPVEGRLPGLHRAGLHEVDLRVVQPGEVRALFRRIVGGRGPGAPDVHRRTLLEEGAGDTVANAARPAGHQHGLAGEVEWIAHASDPLDEDRKSTRLNSS